MWAEPEDEINQVMRQMQGSSGLSSDSTLLGTDDSTMTPAHSCVELAVEDFLLRWFKPE